MSDYKWNHCPNRPEYPLNKLIKEKLHWKPKTSLKEGLKLTYKWIEELVIQNKKQVDSGIDREVGAV